MPQNNLQHQREIYIAAIEDALPKVLSMLDREPMSKTYGCADRVFWSWKFIDFPGARFQEIAYVLATLAKDPAILTRDNVQSQTLIDWTKAAIAYWCTLQHKDGSFDEAYPYERSLAATAFTGFYVGQAFLKIQAAYSTSEHAKLIAVFKSAGDWLCCNDERHGILSNHLAAAAAALETIAEITRDDRYKKRRDHFVARIMLHQSNEGWYEEYGGADPGYQTHTTFYLGYIYTKTKDQTLLASLAASIRFFWHFVHVDGSIGGEYGSRNTRFFMPAGFEMLAADIPEAAAVAHFMRNSLHNEHAVGLHAMDTYNVFPLINNYFFAYQSAISLETQKLLPLPFNSSGITRYDTSGHIILHNAKYQAIISTSKGGAFAAFAKNITRHNPQCSNSGIALEFMNGKRASSQGLQCSTVKFIDDNSVEIDARFTYMNQIIMSPEKFIVFRLINLTAIVFPAFAYHLKNILVKVLVSRKKPCPIRLLRKISWNDHGLKVIDKISMDKKDQVKAIRIGGRFSAIHMGSSRYFEWQELSHQVLSDALSEQQIAALNATGTLVIDHNWSVT